MISMDVCNLYTIGKHFINYIIFYDMYVNIHYAQYAEVHLAVSFILDTGLCSSIIL